MIARRSAFSQRIAAIAAARPACQPGVPPFFYRSAQRLYSLGKKISRRNVALSLAIAATPVPPTARRPPLSTLPPLDILGTARPSLTHPSLHPPWYPLPPYLLFRFFLRTQWSPNPSRTTLPPSLLRYPSFSSYLGGTASRNNSIFLCEYNFAFNLFSPLFPSLARSPAKIPTAVDRLSLPPSLPPALPPSLPPILPLSLSLPCPPRLLLGASSFSFFPSRSRSFFAFSLRFFRSEPSSPPLTSVYGVRPPPASSFSLISRRRLRALSPPPLSPFVQPRCRLFLSS